MKVEEVHLHIATLTKNYLKCEFGGSKEEINKGRLDESMAKFMEHVSFD